MGREQGHVVFTHDLDFGTLLALTRASGPSVIQVRSHNVLPDHLSETVVATIRAYEAAELKKLCEKVDPGSGRSSDEGPRRS